MKKLWRFFARIAAVLLAPWVLPKRLIGYLPEDKIVAEYVRAGKEFGDTISYLYMGEPVGLDALLENWARWERAYAQLGYHTISLDAFIQIGGWGTDPKPWLRIPVEGRVILHAEIYRKQCQGHRNVLARVLEGEQIEGVYVYPSTEQPRKPQFVVKPTGKRP